MNRKMIKILFTWRWLLLLLGGTLLAVCFLPSRTVQFDRSIENMFAPDDPLLAPYDQLKRSFGGNEVVLAVYKDPHLMDEDRTGIDRLADISRQMRETPGVRDVLSLAELDKAIKLLPLNGPSEAGIVDARHALARRFRKLF